MNLKSLALAASLASPLAAQVPLCTPERFSLLRPYMAVDSVLPTVTGPSLSLYSLSMADIASTSLASLDSVDADTLYGNRLKSYYDTAGSHARGMIEREFGVSSRRPPVRVSARFLYDTAGSYGKEPAGAAQEYSKWFFRCCVHASRTVYFNRNSAEPCE